MKYLLVVCFLVVAAYGFWQRREVHKRDIKIDDLTYKLNRTTLSGNIAEMNHSLTLDQLQLQSQQMATLRQQCLVYQRRYETLKNKMRHN